MSEIFYWHDQTVPVLVLDGDVDVVENQALEDGIGWMKSCSAPIPAVVLSCEDVTFADSTLLRFIDRIHYELAIPYSHIGVVASFGTQVRRMLARRQNPAGNHFQLFPSTAYACKAYLREIRRQRKVP